MKLLIIGSKGFIGSNLYRYYSGQQNCDVYGCDINEDSSQNYFHIKNSSDCFEKIFAANKFDYCINASGAANVSASLTNPLVDFQLNTVNVFLLLDAIRKHNNQCKFLNLSSAAVYGNPEKLPISETDPVIPVSPYGLHKLQAEELCEEFFKFWNIQTCCIRIFSAYGPGLGKQLFWDLFQKAKGQQEITLYGTGSETRDFIYINDIVQIIDHVIHKATFNAESVNVANGEQITILDAAAIFFKVLGISMKVNFNNEVRKGDPLNWEADISRLKLLGYRQQYSLEKGLTEYAKWLEELK